MFQILIYLYSQYLPSLFLISFRNSKNIPYHYQNTTILLYHTRIKLTWATVIKFISSEGLYIRVREGTSFHSFSFIMEDLSGAVAATKSAVLGNDGPVYQSGTEPLSGETGKGTATEPYDAGNVETQLGAEPLSGETGKGTATEPYDAGNAPGE
jgi:hypothetical protein